MSKPPNKPVLPGTTAALEELERLMRELPPLYNPTFEHGLGDTIRSVVSSAQKEIEFKALLALIVHCICGGKVVITRTMVQSIGLSPSQWAKYLTINVEGDTVTLLTREVPSTIPSSTSTIEPTKPNDIDERYR